METPILTCTPKQLPEKLQIAAADTATTINPVNHPRLEGLTALRPDFAPTRFEISVVTTKYWRTNGVHLTVGFLDNPAAALRNRIILHMNAWASSANVKFVYTAGAADVRIARDDGDNGGYWSYVGTDILHIPKGEPTLNLEAFTMNTPESEFHRVVRHETGHTLGSPHEHMRRELVALIDPAKAIKYFSATQGWSAAETQAQVLTPIEESTLRGTPHADPNSIMCYQLPGSITKNGKPIVGGLDIDPQDYAFMASIYPPPTKPVSNRSTHSDVASPAVEPAIDSATGASGSATKSARNGAKKAAKKGANKSATKSARKIAKKAAKKAAKKSAGKNATRTGGSGARKAVTKSARSSGKKAGKKSGR